MDELLQKLLEAEVLSPETKKELETGFKTQMDETVKTAKAEAAADVRAELTETWVKEREALIEAIDTKVGEFLEEELGELREDVERFRDLEAEYAEKLVEAKAAMGDELKGDLRELVEKLDAFLEIRLAAEFEELREDIQEQKKNQLGRRIFEAVQAEFAAEYADEESSQASLRETESRLADTEQALEESERKRAIIERRVKLEEVLAPLAGRQREVMEAILKNVDTEQLEEGYKTFIGRVIRESNEDANSEKEGKVLAEGAKEDDDSQEKDLSEGQIKTGDDEGVITEGENDEDSARANRLAKLRHLAGIKS